MNQNSNLIVVLSCEHATNAVPAKYRQLFAGHEKVLDSHRGWDPGTLNLGQALQCKLSAPLFSTSVSRLLVEVNRSLNHPRLFSEFSMTLDKCERQSIVEKFYLPYRLAVENEIERHVATGRIVLHLSLHSFTPVLDGVLRTAEIGLLYDSRRKQEQTFCERLRRHFLNSVPEWRVRRNYPYLGRADGFTTYLRKRFVANSYLGIELEINQSLMSANIQKQTIAKITKAIGIAIF